MGNNYNITDKKNFLDYQPFGEVQVNQQKLKIGRQLRIIKTMTITRVLNNQKKYKSWEDQIKIIHDSETQEIILFPIQKSYQKVGLCGSSGIANLKYENFPFTLESEIKSRKKMKRLFTQTQIWYLLYTLVRVAFKFQKNNKKSGDISPRNIIINEEGQIKVITTCSIPEELSNYDKIIQNIDQKVYLAPQQINEEYIMKGEYPTYINPCKAEAFSIGLTILSAGVLQNCFNLYNIPSSIDELKINQYLRRLKPIYSNSFFSIVCSLLIFNPNQRKKVSDVYSQLSQYEDQIVSLVPFSFKNQDNEKTSRTLIRK